MGRPGRYAPERSSEKDDWSWIAVMGLGTASVRWVVRHRIVIGLVTAALLTRLPLLTISLDEVDTANFVNALIQGYDISLLRPHPPGYPVYVFMGRTLNGVLNDPLLSLALLSSVLGALAVIPFYWLAREFLGAGFAVAGSLLFILNPLIWSFSEAALSDVPGLFFVVVLAWLCYSARTNKHAFLCACGVFSLAIGVRLSNVSLLLLLSFPIGYRLLVSKQFPWTLSVAGAVLFCVTTMAWALPMIFFGSTSVVNYFEVVGRQWSAAVSVSDFTHVLPPWLTNIPLRLERFLYGYLLTYSWTGSDAKTPLALLVASPFLFGFALFITSFRFNSARHVFVALWLASLVPTTLLLHFLPRYGLPQTPGFLLACLMGYAFLFSTLARHPRRREFLAGVVIGCSLILYGIKYQSPVATFEFTPPTGSLYAGLMVVGGVGVLLVLRLVSCRLTGESANALGDVPSPSLARLRRSAVLKIGLALFVLAFGARGYSLASVAHFEKSPNHRLVEFVKARFDTSRITPCWDSQTHSAFEVLIPGAALSATSSAQDLLDAHASGQTLLVTDRCPRWDMLQNELGLSEIGRFEGDSPLWQKTPEVRLYMTQSAP